MAELRVRDLSARAGGREVVTGASFRIAGGDLVALIGPNGSGKTTLLRAALGLIPRAGGVAELEGRDVARLRPGDRARKISYLPQHRQHVWPSPVRDLVALGRFARGAFALRLPEPDAAAVDRALEACGLASLADRPVNALSGGELARVHCARAFAAEARLLVADEPVASLDPLHQQEVVALVRRYVDGGGGALLTVHDIALAARHADRLLWMREGRIVASGTPAETLTPEQVRAVFGIEARVVWSEDGTPGVHPSGGNGAGR